eukprot:3139681-Rhodomonas_salina.1
MPEFPGAVFLNHMGIKTATLGAVAGCLVLAPLSWMRGGRKDALIKTVMPRVAGKLLVGGYFTGVAAGYAMAVADKGPNPKAGWTNESVDDRAYRLVNNKICQDMNNCAGAGAVAGYMTASSGLFGPMAVGVAGGTLAYFFSHKAVPKLRTEVWPRVKPQLSEALTSMGVDANSLTTG